MERLAPPFFPVPPPLTMLVYGLSKQVLLPAPPSLERQDQRSCSLRNPKLFRVSGDHMKEMCYFPAARLQNERGNHVLPHTTLPRTQVCGLYLRSGITSKGPTRSVPSHSLTASSSERAVSGVTGHPALLACGKPVFCFPSSVSFSLLPNSTGNRRAAGLETRATGEDGRKKGEATDAKKMEMGRCCSAGYYWNERSRSRKDEKRTRTH